MLDVKFFLRDRSKEVTEAWASHFKGIAQVEVSIGDIFAVQADAIVSPANSFGYMDGGIDLAYSYRFGWHLQERLQEVIRNEHDGELPVGQAVIIPTRHDDIRWLISAPTMRVPMVIASTVNAYLAFRAVIRAVREHNKQNPESINTVLCPGLGTATGAMPPDRCARQMLAAYNACVLGRMISPNSHQQLVRD